MLIARPRLLIGIAASTDPTITSFFSAKLTVHLYQRGWNAETKSTSADTCASFQPTRIYSLGIEPIAWVRRILTSFSQYIGLFELAIRLKWDLQLFPVLNLCKPHSSSWPALSELKPQSKQALRKGGEIEGMDILANDQIFMSSLYDKDCRFTENVVSDGFAMSPMTSSARGDKSLDVAQFHTTLSWCGTSPRSLGVSEYSTKIRQKGKTLDLIKNKYTADCIGRTYVVVSSTKH